MNNRISSAFDKIKAEKELVEKTAFVLRNAVNNKSTNKIEEKQQSPAYTRILAVACMLLISLFALTFGYKVYKTPVAFISIDINPSLEIGINRFNIVVYADSYNEHGHTLLSDRNILNKNLEEAMTELVDSASDKGFIENNGSTIISVTTETDDPSSIQELQNKAVKGVNKGISSNKKKATILKDNIALSRRDEARRIGISPGKLNLINKAIQTHPEITIEELKDASVKTIMEKVKAGRNISFNKNKNKENKGNSPNSKNNSNKNNPSSFNKGNKNNGNKGEPSSNNKGNNNNSSNNKNKEKNNKANSPNNNKNNNGNKDKPSSNNKGNNNSSSSNKNKEKNNKASSPNNNKNNNGNQDNPSSYNKGNKNKSSDNK